MEIVEIVIGVCAYLLGSVPTGYILGLRAGIDVRKAGSGNVGATNVARVVGKAQGIATLIADALKGFIPVFVAGQVNLGSKAAALAGTAAFLGHLYPLFLGFRGGKGVATALGVFIGIAPLPTLVLIGVFAAVLLSTRIVSLSSMVAAAAAPVTLYGFSYPSEVIGAGAFLAIMIVWRHRSNIKRLLDGEEPKFGASSR